MLFIYLQFHRFGSDWCAKAHMWNLNQTTFGMIKFQNHLENSFNIAFQSVHVHFTQQQKIAFVEISFDIYWFLFLFSTVSQSQNSEIIASHFLKCGNFCIFLMIQLTTRIESGKLAAWSGFAYGSIFRISSHFFFISILIFHCCSIFLFFNVLFR